MPALYPSLGNRPDFPLVWDNTMRSQFVSCPQKWAFEHLYHYKPLALSVHLHAGQAWAAGLEAARTAFYVGGCPADEALAIGIYKLLQTYGDFECPSSSAKSVSRLAEAMVYYFTQYPMATDVVQPYFDSSGKPMIEFDFALPLDDSLRHPVTGDPIIYAGRTDMIATVGSAITIFDDKTTTSLGKSWAQQWDMRSQFTGYAWAARAYGIRATQVLARGISILKTKLDTSEAYSFRSEWRIARWHEQVCRDIRRAMQAWTEGYFDTNEADECSSYGGCAYKSPCMATDPLPWFEANFQKRVWNPLTRTETIEQT